MFLQKIARREETLSCFLPFAFFAYFGPFLMVFHDFESFDRRILDKKIAMDSHLIQK